MSIAMSLAKQTAFLALIALCLMAGTPASKAETPLAEPTNWLAENHRDHPLVGKIWSTEKSEFINARTLGNELKSARFILLGELHDNPDHHRLQADIISAIISKETRPAIVMEMIRVDQMRRVDGYLALENPKPEFFGTAVMWEANGWPDWNIYLPIGKVIINNKLEVYPGLASRALNNHLIKKNIFSLPLDQQKLLKLDLPLEAPLKQAQEDEVRTAHCNKLPERVIKPMAEVQRFRDSFMADVMITAANDDKAKKRPVILLAGAGHTRTDRGAPWFLRKRLEDVKGNNKIVSIQIIEAEEDAKTIADLAAKSPTGEIAADYIWVTPAKTRGNYCDSIPDFGKYKD